MLSDNANCTALMSQHLSTQVPKTTVAENRHDFAASQWNLFGNATGRCDGFCENCFVVSHMIRNSMQIAFGHNDGIRKRAVVGDDADDRAMRAVIGQLSSAHLTCMTRTVDFADNSLADEAPGTGDADKLMAQRATKTHVALAELQIRFADPGFDDIHNDVVVAGLPKFCIGAKLQSLVEYDRSHRIYSGT